MISTRWQLILHASQVREGKAEPVEQAEIVKDAQQWLGARVFQFQDFPELQDMTPEKRYWACLSFFGVLCGHPPPMREDLDSWPRSGHSQYRCKACGTTVSFRWKSA